MAAYIIHLDGKQSPVYANQSFIHSLDRHPTDGVVIASSLSNGAVSTKFSHFWRFTICHVSRDKVLSNVLKDI